jgi:ubiquinone/menaquinone biosynthesis C-methylase UbiE
VEADVKEWLKEKGKEFLKDIGIKEGQVVLDFGCNVGHYTIPAAEVVGEEGRVYAIDKDIESLNELMRTAKIKGLRNIVPILIQSSDLKINLKDESVDVILLYDVLHYIDAMGRNKIYNESYRILKNDGLLSVYPKHNKSDEPLWNLSNMQLEDVIKEIESTKFRFERQFYKKLIHNNIYNMGYILNFIKMR